MSDNVKSTNSGGLVVTNSMKQIGASAPHGSELYVTDSSNRKVELVGYDHNRELLLRTALKKAGRLLGKEFTRADAKALGIERDLVERDSQIWEEERAELTSAAFLPMDGRAGRYADAKKYEWRKKEMFSDAIVKAHLGGVNSDIPSVNAGMVAQEEQIWNVLSSYEVTVEQEMFQGRLNFNFGSEFAAECRMAIARKIDQMLLLGDADLAIDGFYNHPEIPVSTLLASDVDFYNGGSSSQQVLNAFHTVMNEVRAAIKASSVTSAPMPDSLLLSTRVHAYFTEVATFGTASDRTLMSLIQERYGSILRNIDFSYELEGAGAGGADRCVIYKKDPSFVKAAVPTPYQERPVLVQPYSEVVHAYARFVPVIVHDKRPLRYFDVVGVAP